MPSRLRDQIMQVYKVPLVPGEADAILANCLGKMDRVLCTQQAGIARKLDFMPGLP